MKNDDLPFLYNLLDTAHIPRDVFSYMRSPSFVQNLRTISPGWPADLGGENPNSPNLVPQDCTEVTT